MNYIIEEDLKFITGSKLDWDLFSGKNILITGANGFLPAYTVETLLYLNIMKKLTKPCKIIAVVRNVNHARERFSDYLDNPAFKLMVHDISEPFHIKEKVDFIIHAASPASPKYYGIDPVGVIMPNVIGTINILNIAKEKGSTVMYFSSAEVYGKNTKNNSIKENSYGTLDPLDLRSCYGESKRMGENLCISYGHQYNIPVKIVRISHTYGPGMKLDDGRVFADFVSDIVNDRNIKLKSDGSVTRSFCYISDATIGFFTVLLQGGKNEAYNVANPDQTISIKELANTLVNLFPEKKLKVLFSKQDNLNYIETKINKNKPDIGKIKKLGWHPVISVEEGFYRTVMSYL